jgi:precorrin-3B synthase
MNAPLRRGVCPGLSAPMQTGDGLLVRLLPIGTIPLTAFAALCTAARTHGNGIVEITARGSIQVRGLSASSAPRFTAIISALGIAAQDGVPVLTNPLIGLDPNEIFDAAALASELRRALTGTDLAARLSPKVSVIVDGGDPGIDALSADVRVRAEPIEGRVALQISVGGDGTSATPLGAVAPVDAVEAVVCLLEIIATRGRGARARDIVAAENVLPFQKALASCPGFRQAKEADGGDRSGHVQAEREIIGLQWIRDGSLACGVGFAFGHADATMLEELADAANKAGACGMRTAPARVLMAIGLAPEKLPTFLAAAERLGFIVRADDPRRRVVACAGAPICASAHIATRALAPQVAAAAGPLLDAGSTIHLSGCAKGCAHPVAAALTAVGTAHGCALIANGTTRDASFAVVAPDQLIAALADAMREASHV